MTLSDEEAALAKSGHSSSVSIWDTDQSVTVIPTSIPKFPFCPKISSTQ